MKNFQGSTEPISHLRRKPIMKHSPCVGPKSGTRRVIFTKPLGEAAGMTNSCFALFENIKLWRNHVSEFKTRCIVDGSDFI